MGTLKSYLVLAASAAILCVASAAEADVIVIASSAGWITSSGLSNTSGFNGGINFASAGHHFGIDYNNFFQFTLPDQTISSATLYIWNEGENFTSDSSAVYSLHAPTAFSFIGLGAAASLGSVTANVADTGVDHYVAIALNGSGLSYLNSNLSGAINFGGTVSTISTGEVQFFGYTLGMAHLDLAFAAPGPVPGAGFAGLVSLALAGLYARTRQA